MNLSSSKTFSCEAKDYVSFYNENGEPRVNIEGVVEIGGDAYEQSIVDTTDVSDGTYYPSATGMSFGNYKNLSITGKLIDGVGETTTLKVEVTNDEDVENADWAQICLYDIVNNAVVSSVSATNNTKLFALLVDNFNFKYLRFKIDATAATNTVIIKMRRSY